MSSGYPGSDFYSYAGIRGGPGMNNSVRVQYRPQLGGILVDPSPSPVIPRHPALAKRPLTELEMMQQQQQNLLLLRSVKQRTHLTSPISPLPPIDLSSVSPDISTTTTSSSSSSVRLGVSPFQQCQQQQATNPNSCNFSFSAVPNRFYAPIIEPDSDKNMRNRLQELERQLLDDDEEDCSAVSAVTTSGWSETMQNLITPKHNPTSPTSSSSSSITTSTSPSPPSASSSKQLLFDSVTAISEGKTETAAGILARLKQVSNPHSGDAEQRLAAYMVGALLSRINPAEGGGGQPIAELCSSEHMVATQMLFEASPCFKLGFMAANLAILEATRDQLKIHIVDFDIGQGNQYITLIHALAGRQSVRPTVKITAVTDPNSINCVNSSNGLQVVGDRLKKLAERVGVGLRFAVRCSRVPDLSRESICCDPDEALAVNFAFRLYKMADESVSTANPRDELLRVVKGMRPTVVTLVEQEMNANTAPFLARFGEAWAYYRALFESLDATLTRDRPERVRVEECLARKAANSVAREGRDRVERCEVLGKWRARMGMAGFEPRTLSVQIAESMRDRAKAFPGFFVKEESGGIYFGWMGRILTAASSWR